MKPPVHVWRFELMRKGIALFLDGTPRVGHCEFPSNFAGFKLCLQFLHFRIFGCGGFMQCTGNLELCQLNGAPTYYSAGLARRLRR